MKHYSPIYENIFYTNNNLLLFLILKSQAKTKK